uniref:RNA helicase n=1 Tax=Parastrongyloides trichosuri TaxID=131310 RepID=A0A0N4ZH17_PARTI
MVDFITYCFDIKDYKKTQNVESFVNLDIPSGMVRRFNKMGILKPSFNQLILTPIAISRRDMVVQINVDLDKLVIFAITSIDSTSIDKNNLQTVIISTTNKKCKDIYLFLEDANFKKLKIGLCCDRRDTKIGANSQIIISTVECLIQMINNEEINLNNVTTLIIDRVDEMIDENLEANISKVASSCSKKKKVCIFSLMYSQKILNILSQFMIDAMMMKLIHHDAIPVKIKQYVHFDIIENQFTPASLMAAKILKSQQFNQAIVFINDTKLIVDFANQLCKHLKEYAVQLMSGSMLQKDHIKVMDELNNKKVKVLVSTDSMSRGIDSQHIDLVININCPINSCIYFKRLERASKSGNNGLGITLIDNEKDLLKFVDMVDTEKLIVKYLNKEIMENSSLIINKNIFEESLMFNGKNLKKKLFSCDRLLEKNILNVIKYTKDVLLDIKINVDHTKTPCDISEKDVLVDIKKASTKEFHNKRNCPFDKYTKLRSKFNAEVLSKENINDNNKFPEQNIDKNNVKETISMDNNIIEKQEVIRYSRSQMMEIFNSRNLEQWNVLFKELNLRKEIYKSDPIISDMELRKPFAIQLRILREREKERTKKLRREMEKHGKKQKNIVYGKVTRNWFNETRFPSLPLLPDHIYGEVYDLTTGNGKYYMLDTNEMVISPSLSIFKQKGENMLQKIVTQNKTLSKRWFLSQANSSS